MLHVAYSVSSSLSLSLSRTPDDLRLALFLSRLRVQQAASLCGLPWLQEEQQAGPRGSLARILRRPEGMGGAGSANVFSRRRAGYV